MKLIGRYELQTGTLLYLNGSLCTVKDIEPDEGFWTKEIFFDFHRATKWYDFKEDSAIPLLSKFTEEELIQLTLGMKLDDQNIR